MDVLQFKKEVDQNDLERLCLLIRETIKNQSQEGFSKSSFRYSLELDITVNQNMEAINKTFIEYQKDLARIKQLLMQKTESEYLDLQSYLETIIQHMDSLYDKFLDLEKKKQEGDLIKKKIRETSQLLSQANSNIQQFGERQRQIKEEIMEINAQKMEVKFPGTKKHQSQKEIQDYLVTLQNTYDADLFTRKEDLELKIKVLRRRKSE